MGFWLFCLATVLLVPGVMLYFGRVFQIRPPRDINALYGYRTSMSGKNQKTWSYAHQVCGRLWWRLGIVLIPVGVVPFLFVIGEDVSVVGCRCAIVACVQVAVIVSTIIPVEIALHKKFDRYGREKETL